MKTLLAAVICVVLPPTAAADDWGTISGRIVVTGQIPEREILFRKGTAAKDAEVCSAQDVYANDLLIDPETRGLANCYVYLYKAPERVNEKFVDSTSTVYFDSKNCRFYPHVMVVQVGQTIEILNSDPIALNPRTDSSSPDMSLGALVAAHTGRGQGVPVRALEKSRLPISVKCDYHRHMQAYWLIVDHPYATLTNEKGEFTIPGLPVGDHEFRVWHERCGWVERNFNVTVAKGESEVPALEVAIEKLERKSE